MFLHFILPYAVFVILWFAYEIYKAPKVLENEVCLSGKDYKSKVNTNTAGSLRDLEEEQEKTAA